MGSEDQDLSTCGRVTGTPVDGPRSPLSSDGGGEHVVACVFQGLEEGSPHHGASFDLSETDLGGVGGDACGGLLDEFGEFGAACLGPVAAEDDQAGVEQ